MKHLSNQKVSSIPNLVPSRINDIVNKINIGLLPRIPAWPQHLYKEELFTYQITEIMYQNT